ncbi:MAG: histidine kinase [Lachnospiraceae bacterium]|nr:histidine kinase [Lachnospiraceae bacterium]
MRKRNLYLNQTILIVVMLGYSAFLVLMLLADWYLIQEYQDSRREKEQQAVNSYVTSLYDSMSRVNLQMSELYANDQNFSNLSKETETVDQFSNSYDLRETLKKRMLVDENLSGFYIFYNNGENVLWQIDTDKIEDYHAKQLKSMLKQRMENENIERKWIALSVEDVVYLAIGYKMHNAVLFGICSMNNVESAIQENAGTGMEIVLVENESVLTNETLGEKLEIYRAIEGHTDSFQQRILNYQVYGRRVPNMDLWVCSVKPMNIWSLMNIQQLLLLLLTLLSIIAVCSIYVFMKKQVVQPLHQLTDNMNIIRRGESQEVYPMDNLFYEIREANETLREMIHELNQQKMLVYEEIIEKQKAQMQYLQLQLKPHFYLNGLKTLNALALENQTEKMQDLILSLSEYLHYLMQVEREEVPLRKELEFVENYINMQKYVTGRPVSCEIMKDEEIAEWLIPVLAVHTFVENSVKYARLGGSGVPLKIQITASYLSTEEGEFMDLIVEDNGYGYPKEILAEINGDAAAGNQCVGINNIKRRCRIMYGDKAEYNFSNDRGAVSELIIPHIVKED